MARPLAPPPQSCDTFVVVGSGAPGAPPTIFGKNSDRPSTEVHEVVRFGRKEHPPGAKTRTQFLSIPEVPRTHAVILSRPTWLWGAEMGANEHGVCAGNEAVFSREAAVCDDGVKRLLGMDLVRLVLERASTAREAVQVAGDLMETHGQGGPCEDGGDWCYENGFMFVDANEAWVFETAGVSFWAAEQIAKGKTRNISNGLSIRKPTLLHKDLLATAQKEGWWDGKGDFDWKRVMLGNSSPSEELSPEGREQAGIDLLKKNTSKKAPPFGFEGMAAILRDTDSDICMRGAFESTGSQISVLTPGASGDEHWFTTSSDPSKGCYKPFAFGEGGDVGAEGDLVRPRKCWNLTKCLKKDGAVQMTQMREESEAKLRAQAKSERPSPAGFDKALDAELAQLETILQRHSGIPTRG